jgi:hypothetical protein
MKPAIRFLLDNKCDDLILNDRKGIKPEDRIYASDIMEKFLNHNTLNRDKVMDRITKDPAFEGLPEYAKERLEPLISDALCSLLPGKHQGHG